MRFPQLDGLRAVAVAGVMLCHTGLLSGAGMGVDIFFVLSGFLITSLLIKEFRENGGINLRRFYMRRALRLLPAMWALITVYVICATLSFSGHHLHDHLIDAVISICYVSNWARAFNMHPPVLLGHTWSLAMEWQFYLLWPVLLLTYFKLTGSDKHLVYLAIIMALVSIIIKFGLTYSGASGERLYNGLDTHGDVLLFGCFLACTVQAAKNVSGIACKLSNIVAIISASSFLSLVILISTNKLSGVQIGLISIAFEALITIIIFDIVTNPTSIISQALSRPFIVWCGTISYGLYLYHYPIFKLLESLGYRISVVGFFGSIITFAVASLSYYLLELPFLRMKNNFKTIVDCLDTDISHNHSF